jgi:phosphatidylinositol alpha-mannosyltransferase
VSNPVTAEPTCRRTRLSRTHLGSATVLLMFGAMVALAVTRINLGAASTLLANASLFWVLIAALAVAAAFLLRSESWYAALRAALPGSRISRPVVARSLLIGVAVSTLTPARIGEAVRTWLLSRRIGEQGVLPTVLGTVVAQTLLNLLALALLALFTLTDSTGHGFHTQTIAAAIALPILVFLALVAASRLLTITWPTGDPGEDAGPARRVGCWFSRQVSGTGRGMAVFSRPSSAVHSGGCQLGAWILQGFACYAVLIALGLQHHTSPATAAAVLLAINITAVVPITPANVGVFQAACIAVLTPLGISSGHALAYGLLLQGVEIAVALTMAVPALLREGLSIRELGRAAGRGRLVVLGA